LTKSDIFKPAVTLTCVSLAKIIVKSCLFIAPKDADLPVLTKYLWAREDYPDKHTILPLLQLLQEVWTKKTLHQRCPSSASKFDIRRET